MSSELLDWRQGIIKCLLFKGITHVVMEGFSKDQLNKVSLLIDSSLPLEVESLSVDRVKKLQMFVATDIELKLRM